MTKLPSPKADGLRAMREATRGHLQAKVTAETEQYFQNMASRAATPPKKKPLIPYAGKAGTTHESSYGAKRAKKKGKTK